MSLINIFAGWIAGILGFLAFIPYIIAIFKRETTPNRATWVIWTIVSTISLLSYSASGASQSIWYPLSDAIAPLIVLTLSIKFGEGGWTSLDLYCLSIAGAGLFCWWVSGSAVIGLCINLLADAMGAIPTAVKAYRRPKSEDRISWAITFSAIVINFAAIEDWKSFSLMIYPIYMFISMGIITFFVWRRSIRQWHL